MERRTEKAGARAVGKSDAQKAKGAGRKAERGAKAARSASFTKRNADRHQLYQLSVQAPDHEIDFVQRVYRGLRKRAPLSLREDFCGTALLCAAWVKSHPERTATGVDICGDTLAWGREHNIAPLGAEAARVELLCEDVRAKRKGRFDVINALNFSYWVFRTRAELLVYFRAVRKSLAAGGLFVLDAYGGWEASEPMEEARRVPAGFTYVWEQHSFDPVTHAVTNYIHFRFRDGTALNRAFIYEWRFWTLPELTELLREAGFSRVDVHFDVAEDDEKEDYRVVTRAKNQPGFLVYLVAGDD